MNQDISPGTAFAGPARSGHDRLARSLGWFSIGLGAVELAAARALARGLAIDGRAGLLRAYGVREVATGIAILASPDPTPWIWGRVIGDALDLATLATGARRATGGRRFGVGLALASVAGVTALDVLCAQGLEAETGDSAAAARG